MVQEPLTPGPKTWKAVAVAGEGDPGVAFDRSGNAYFTYVDVNQSIRVQKSTDGGATWAAAVSVSQSLSGYQDKPAIVVGPDHANTARDRIYVGWDDNSRLDVLMVSSSGDGGKTW